MTGIKSGSLDGWRAIGRVAGVFRHPIKSMAAQAMTCAAVDRYGIAGDRRFALRRLGDESGFPWLSASKLPALVRYEVACAVDEAPTRESMHVRAPSGDVISCAGDALSRHFASAHGVDVELTNLRQGIFDLAGLGIITTQTLASIAAMLSLPMDVRRFRPNVLIDVGSSGDPYPEDAWVGSSLAFGDPVNGARAMVTELDERCAMINLDPDSGLSTPTILRTVVRERDNFAGVYATPTRPGAVAIGDLAYVRRE